MLYIFHVDTGTMITFDMDLAMDTVTKLQCAIAKSCHIAEDKQVLLINGGESLNPTARVCSYSAGTDTNPIYLFSKTTIEAATPPSPSVHYGSDIDLQEQVEGSLIMPPSFETVVSRAQLALQFQDVDREELIACERLVHDQHLQQQGWAAVVANLEDITSALQRRCDMFQTAYRDYLVSREQFITLLQGISSSLELLSKIPILRSLLPESDFLDELSLGESDDVKKTTTLYQWISTQDSNHSLEEMVTQCSSVTEQFNSSIADTLSTEVAQTFESVNNQSMKEVKGLEDRLYGLDQIMSGARRLVKEQAEMAKGFAQNQTRAGNLRDPSILPDLCASHKKQLLVMLNNHRKLREIKRKCRMAKEELSVNLHTRLRWVMFVEKRICDIDGRLMLYHENLKRLRKRLDILQQISDAPQVYARLVVEVVRRRKFSSHFIKWANGVAERSSSLHTDEYRKRKTFLQELGKHFLQALFQGYEDFPPKFATEAPAEFDCNLPHITEQDLELLQEAIPELAESFRLPSPDSQSSALIFSPTMHSSACQVGVSQGDGMVTTDQGNIPVSASQIQQCATDESPVHQTTSTHSGAASDIDVLHDSFEHGFSPIECAGIDFGGDHIAGETEDALKDTTAVFVMPRSLSHNLTSAMTRPTQTEKKGEHSGTSVSAVTSVTRSKVKGEDPAHARSPKSSTVSAAVSSEEFTTADFYIDESMPSSISDTLSNTRSSDNADLTLLIQEKGESMFKLESELQEVQGKLTSHRHKLKNIQQSFHSNICSLQGDLICVKNDMQCTKTEFTEFITNFERLLLLRLTSYDSYQNGSHTSEIQKLEELFDSERVNLVCQVAEAETNISGLSRQLHEQRTELEHVRSDYIVQVGDLEMKVTEVKEAADTQHEQLIQQHAADLEMEEAEITKIKDEFQVERIQQEQLLQQKEAELIEMWRNFESTIALKNEEIEAVYERSASEKADIRLEIQELQSRFSAERERILSEICEIRSHCEDAIIDARAECETMIVKVKLNHVTQILARQQEYQNEIDALKSSLSENHTTEIDELRLRLEQDTLHQLEDLRTCLRAEHVAELEKCRLGQEEEKAALLLDHERHDAELRAVFEQEKADLVSHIDDLHRPSSRDPGESIASQTLMLGENAECQTSTTAASDVSCQIIPSVQHAESQMSFEFTDNACQVSADLTDGLNPVISGSYESRTSTGSDDVSWLITTNSNDAECQTESEGQDAECQVVCESAEMSCQKDTDGCDVTCQIEVPTDDATCQIASETNDATCQIVLEMSDASSQMEPIVSEMTDASSQMQPIVSEMTDAGSQIVLAMTDASSQMEQLESHVTKVSDDSGTWDSIKQKLVYEHHKEELEDLRIRMELDKEASLASLRASLTASKQVVFNEAVSKITSDKEKMMEEWRNKEIMYKSQHQHNTNVIEKLTTESKTLIEERQSIEDKCRGMGTHRQQLEDDLAQTAHHLTMCRSQLGIDPSPGGSSFLTTSTMTEGYGSGEEKSLSTDRMTELEMALKTKKKKVPTATLR